MSQIPYTSPYLNGKAFNCPHCKAYSKQRWANHFHDNKEVQPLYTALCENCIQYSVWWYNVMLYPKTSSVEQPNSDLPYEIQELYKEAGQIVGQSPRAAAALLRLAIQQLCVHLGGKGKKLNDDIATFVKNGLPSKVQKMLDTVRVIGNNAVHPGEIDADNEQTAQVLFRLVNLIAEKMISEPKAIDEVYSSLPEKEKENIAKRDGEGK